MPGVGYWGGERGAGTLEGKGGTMATARVARVGRGLVALLGATALAAGCGSPAPGPDPESGVTSPTRSVHAASSTTSSSSPTTSTPAPAPETTAAQAPAAVVEGAMCGPRGAVAAFADGTTAYCARLQYTDGSAWSRDPSLAPNPAVESALQQAGPQIGDQCHGYQIDLTAVDSHGNAIVCDNYQWVLNVGQEPRHPWVEDQLTWTECLETRTEQECRDAGI